MENKLTDILSQADFKEIHAKILHCYEQSSRAGAHQEFLSEDRDLMRKVLEFEKVLFAPSEPVGGVKGAEEIEKAIQDIETCFEEAPIDFLGTGSNSNFADKQEREWRKKHETAVLILRKFTSQFQQPQVDEKQNSDDAYNEEMKQVYNSAIDEAINKLRSFTYPDADDFRNDSKHILEELSKLKKP